MSDNLLSRHNALLLRGAAIIFIILHNFLHLPQFGFSRENETFFSSERVAAFFNAIEGGSNIICEFLSHLGWIGVPVFVFLTGYGVALSPPPVSYKKSVNYTWHHYLKLLMLMLLAVLFFIVIDIFNGVGLGVLKRVSYLTMLANFVYPYVRCNPGVYWYFGLTFQFYLLWAFLGRYMKGWNLFVWSTVLLLGLYGLYLHGPHNLLWIFRASFTGWFPVFAIGVWLGIRKTNLISKMSAWNELLICVILLCLILFMGRWMITWLFVPIIALAWFLVVGLLLMRTRYLSELFRWFGRYSACIFVCHPIARLIVNKVVNPVFFNLAVIVLLYLVATVVIVYFYDKLYKWLLSKLVSKQFGYR